MVFIIPANWLKNEGKSTAGGGATVELLWSNPGGALGGELGALPPSGLNEGVCSEPCPRPVA